MLRGRTRRVPDLRGVDSPALWVGRRQAALRFGKILLRAGSYPTPPWQLCGLSLSSVREYVSHAGHPRARDRPPSLCRIAVEQALHQKSGSNTRGGSSALNRPPLLVVCCNFDARPAIVYIHSVAQGSSLSKADLSRILPPSFYRVLFRTSKVIRVGSNNGSSRA